jgi:ribosomal protein S27AE
MKACFKCHAVKPLIDFYKNSGMPDGHVNKCKECNKKDVLEYRQSNIEKVREYDRQRGKLPSRIKKSIEITKAWRAADKRRMAAHNAVARALKKGLLVPQPCSKCSSEVTVAHHEDYDKPLDVVWLCQACHKKRHIELLS